MINDMKNELFKTKKWILNYYEFHENGENELYCALEDGRFLIFKFFPKGSAVDLLLRKYLLYTGLEDEEVIKTSFYLDNKDHVKILDKWHAKRLSFLKKNENGIL